LEFNVPFQHKYGYIRDECLTWRKLFCETRFFTKTQINSNISNTYCGAYFSHQISWTQENAAQQNWKHVCLCLFLVHQRTFIYWKRVSYLMQNMLCVIRVFQWKDMLCTIINQQS